MKETNTNGYQIQSDGRTVWVNGVSGACLGRFGPKGVDIHHDIMNSHERGECLDCTHHAATSEDWDRFVQGMEKFHNVVVPQKHKPEWLE